MKIRVISTGMTRLKTAREAVGGATSKGRGGKGEERRGGKRREGTAPLKLNPGYDSGSPSSKLTDLSSESRGFESRPRLLCTKVNSAYKPSIRPGSVK